MEVPLSNPYLITGPALISFSGGRTSAYMLKMILDAHGGVLPDDVHVCFANTGKEREETLRFVHECATRWGVRVRWLERRSKEGFDEVGYNSASRLGEPFAALIAENGYLPNIANPWCSIALKQRVCNQFARSLGWGRYSSIVGLRADEPGRVKAARKRTESKRDGWNTLTPLSQAGVTKRDVLAFWGAQDFDLGLLHFEGNCDGCFQKRMRLYEVERYRPGSLDWWMEQERAVSETAKPDASRWIIDLPYSRIQMAVRNQPDLYADLPGDDEMPAECGLMTCGGGA